MAFSCMVMHMEIEKVSILDLTLDPKNARVHSEESIHAVAESLRLFGLQKPIVIDRANKVVAGNGTVQAAFMLGWITLSAVRVPDEWSEEMITAFAIADNRTGELSGWNKDILAEQLLDLNEEELNLEWLGFKEEAAREEKPLEEFPEFNDDTATSYRCPKCEYEWNGSPR